MKSLELDVFEGAVHGRYIARWIADPLYKHFFQGIGMVPTMADCVDYPRWTGHSVMMVSSGSSVVGMVCMYRPSYRNGTCEVGLLIDKAHQSRGVAAEAGKLWQEFLFSLGFRKVTANILDEGLSQVLTKRGWKLEGVHEKEALIDDEYVTEYRLAYIREV